jgi:hypothetical protein
VYGQKLFRLDARRRLEAALRQKPTFTPSLLLTQPGMT